MGGGGHIGYFISLIISTIGYLCLKRGLWQDMHIYSAYNIKRAKTFSKFPDGHHMGQHGKIVVGHWQENAC